MPQRVTEAQKKLINQIRGSLYEMASQTLNSSINLSNTAQTETNTPQKKPLNPKIYVPVYAKVEEIPNQLPKNKFASMAEKMIDFLKTHKDAILYESNGILFNSPKSYLIDLLIALYQSYTFDPFEGVPIKINTDTFEELLKNTDGIIDKLYEQFFGNENERNEIIKYQLALSFLYTYFDPKIQALFTDNGTYAKVLQQIKQPGYADTHQTLDNIFAYPRQRISRLLLNFIELTNNLIKLHENFSEDSDIKINVKQYIDHLEEVIKSFQIKIDLIPITDIALPDIKKYKAQLEDQKELVNFYLKHFKSFFALENSFSNFITQFDAFITEEKNKTALTSKKPIEKLNDYIEKVNRYLESYNSIEACLLSFKHILADKDTVNQYSNELTEYNNEFYLYLDQKKKSLLSLKLNFNKLAAIHTLLDAFIQPDESYQPYSGTEQPTYLEEDISAVISLIETKIKSIQENVVNSFIKINESSKNIQTYKPPFNPNCFIHSNTKQPPLDENDMEDFDVAVILKDEVETIEQTQASESTNSDQTMTTPPQHFSEHQNLADQKQSTSTTGVII
ncbi:hypothetical protein L3V82_10615 [Thiotrichales bacterium 19S3-7]|nr:hypothetical protein [Thiotrichales bacterium 19S3-7]MCF6802609.1 hypothetical protein [Thiotrichales bacterium 19S3-11]